MNPRIGWLAAAAAGLVVVIVALATINRPADDSVGASSSPIVSPSAPLAGAAVPIELQAMWMSGPRSITGFDADAGVSLTFTATGGFSMNGSLIDRPDHMLSSVEILGIPAGTARSRLHHAHRAMRAALEADARVPAIGGQLG